MIYSKSFLLGFLEGSFDKKPKKNRETKNTTVVYTKIFKVNISHFLKIIIFLYIVSENKTEANHLYKTKY